MLLILKKDLLKIFVISILIALSLITVMQDLAAAEGFKLSASNEKGASGSQVVVTIKAENAAGTEGGQFLLTFDPNLVRPVSVEAGNLIARSGSLLQMGNLEYAPGQLMYMWVTVYGDTDDAGNVCKIVFDLLREGETVLRFAEVVVAPESVGTAASLPGRIIIGSSASATEPAAGEPSAPDQDREQSEPVDSADDSEINDVNGTDDIEDDSDEKAGETVNDNELGLSSSLYIIGGAVAVLLITGYLVVKHLKKKARKRKKRKNAGRTKD